MDVLPDIELGPVGDGEDADAFVGFDVGVVEVPELGALSLWVPAMTGGAEGEDPLLGTAFFFVTAGAAKDCIKAMFVERLLERLGLHDISVVVAAVGKRIDTGGQPVEIGMDKQLHAAFGNHPVAVNIHFLKLPAGIDMKERKRGWRRIKGLARKMEHDR